MYERVMVPLDGSRLAEGILPFILQIAGPQLAAAARDAGADLIAMTTHGRSGLVRLLFGSVAESVLRQGNVPVLMMRLTGRQVSSAEVATVT